MSAVIDNAGDGEDLVSVGENSPVSMKVYQAVYNQLTGRTETLSQKFKENLLIDFDEIQQLHHKVAQMCDVHNVIAQNLVITVLHDEERKEQFTSWDRFAAYNAGSASPTANVILKYNFSIMPAGISRPQEYVVTVRLTSRAAALRDFEKEAPHFMQGRFVSFLTEVAPVDLKVEYVDYVIARGFNEAVAEWVKGCSSVPPNRFLKFAQRWTHLMPGSLRTLTLLAYGSVALYYLPAYFSGGDSLAQARFVLLFTIATLVTRTAAGFIGMFIDQLVHCYPVMSYLKLNRGDAKMIEQFESRKKSVLFRAVLAAVSTIALGVISAKLERLV